ncbi:MAG: N-acetyl-gamma-glutamyl-phosphate reductase [Bacteroidetes bacterium]|nr:MAG: N-acetyl-gamma-glutamyl-phosphate reductase [Bacteroidota bacterium]
MTNKKQAQVGIAGAAGYTGGELIRILLNHPNAEIAFAHSKSNGGNPVSDVHSDLLGDTDLKFSSVLSNKIDVLFLCMGQSESVKFLSENKISTKIKIIDLSQDFRLNPMSQVSSLKSKAAERTFVYGLPELNRDEIKKADNIANPGCFATAIQLALLPLADKKLLNDEVHVSAVTGSTGAGQALSATGHFTWRNNNISIYKAFQHQHLGEITQSLKQLQPKFSSAINFVPYRGNFTRGILAAVYVNSNLSLEEAKNIFKSYYKSHPFVTVSDKNPDVKQAVNTNKCILYLEKHDDNLFIQSVIDNLTKGASGQAVQNMNLMFGLDETTGLKLKPSAF